MGYLAYVVVTQVEKGVLVSDVPIVREFPNTFSEELLDVPPARKVQFRIDLIPVTTLIAKVTYRLASTDCMNFPLSFRSYWESSSSDRSFCLG